MIENFTSCLSNDPPSICLQGFLGYFMHLFSTPLINKPSLANDPKDIHLTFSPHPDRMNLLPSYKTSRKGCVRYLLVCFCFIIGTMIFYNYVSKRPREEYPFSLRTTRTQQERSKVGKLMICSCRFIILSWEFREVLKVKQNKAITKYITSITKDAKK